MGTRLTSIVLRSERLEALLAFYGALGLAFQQEQHGNGPVHHSTTSGDLVLELYSGKPGDAPERLQGGASMLGFTVDSLESVLGSLEPLNVTIVSQPKSTPWGLRMVVLDPDGRAVGLYERS